MSKSYKFKAVDKYPHILKMTYRGFDYRISFSMYGQLQGVVWVTSHIVQNYENYGLCLFIDATKRQHNYIDWPYILVVVLNRYKKVVNDCKPVSCSQQIIVYKRVLYFVIFFQVVFIERLTSFPLFLSFVIFL